MKLRAWLIQQGIAPATFAREQGVPRSIIYRLYHEERDTWGRHWARITAGTDGAVTPADHYPPERRRKRAA